MHILILKEPNGLNRVAYSEDSAKIDYWEYLMKFKALGYVGLPMIARLRLLEEYEAARQDNPELPIIERLEGDIG